MINFSYNEEGYDLKTSASRVMGYKMIKYGAAILITMALGLASRRFSGYIPSLLAEHAGDMLWASMVYYGCRSIMKKKRLSLAVMLSILFSFSIEFSQLYQSPWITELRNSTLGALVLGRGFLWVDLVRYALGIALAYSVDKLWLFEKEIRERR